MAIQRRLEGDSKEFFTFSHGRGFLVIPRGVSCQRVYFPAAIGINLKDFQNILGDLQKSLENILFSKKSSKKICVFLGFGISALLISNQGSCSLRTCRANSLFLLLMDENLAEVLKGMSLGEDKSIIIPEDDDFCAIERGGRSILGRLLNPECQNMGRMLKTMPKIWKVYERVRGLALTKERFQFVFDLETDIQMVLKQGFWTFDEWGMAMERWVEMPSPNYLQTATIWVRLHNIPVNYLMLKTIDAVADGIGHVKLIEFDRSKPHLLEYVRVQVVLDINQPLRDRKSLTLPGGRIEYVDVEYERVGKKCFHCLRLSHEKQKCPLLQGSGNKGKGVVSRQHAVEVHPAGVRQHHNDHVEKLMPLMAPTIPPGFEPPPSIVAPEVFEQMRLYMECVDPEERRIREAKMRKTLQELSTDPIAQRSCLRLERAPVISADINRDRGRVFDFSRVGTDAILNVAESSSYGSQRRVDLLEDGEIRRTMGTVSTKRVGENTNLEQRQREDAQNEPRYPRKEVRHNDARLGGSQLVNERDRGFVMGAETSNGSERSSRSRNTSSSRSSWTRRNQNKRRVTQVSEQGKSDAMAQRNMEEGPAKRKAQDESEVSSKMAKQVKGLVVSPKPSHAQ